MIPKSFYSLSILLATLFIASGCSKNDADTSAIVQQENLQGSWSVTGIQSDKTYDWDGNGSMETDILATYNSCNRNIVYVFETGGAGRVSEGCTAPFVNFRWQLSGTRLSMEGIPSGNINLQLTQLSSSTLKGTDNINVNGTNYQITYIFTKRIRG